MARQSRAHNNQLHLYPSLGIPSRGGVGSGPDSHLSSSTHTRQQLPHLNLIHGTRYDGRAHKTNTTRQRRKIRNALKNSVAIHVHSVLPGLLRRTRLPIPRTQCSVSKLPNRVPQASLTTHPRETRSSTSESFSTPRRSLKGLYQNSALSCTSREKGAEGISTNVTVTAVKQQCLLYPPPTTRR